MLLLTEDFLCHYSETKHTIFQLAFRIITFGRNQQQKEYLYILSFAKNQVIKTTAYQVQTLFFLFCFCFIQVQMPSEDLLSHQSTHIAIVMCILFCFSFGIGKSYWEYCIVTYRQNYQLKWPVKGRPFFFIWCTEISLSENCSADW